MKISAISVDKDVLITINPPADKGDFLGYMIERKQESEPWKQWNGTTFFVLDDLVEEDPLEPFVNPVTYLQTERFTDYDLEGGIYQYRLASVTEETIGYVDEEDPGVTGEVLSEFVYTDWVRIGTQRIGWTFLNYSVPQGQFGDILTADDLRYTYLWGIDFKASNGETFTDAQIKSKIHSSVLEIARALKITIYKTRIKCNPAKGVLGEDYDETEDAYTYRSDRWHRTGRVILRKRPILSVDSFVLQSITDQKILDLENWARIDHRKGVIGFFPRAGANSEIRITPAVMTMGMSFLNGSYPHGYKIDYTAGFENASLVPDDLRDIIAKAAACKLLNIIGDGLIAGFSSSSLSMDGVSESFSSTQSATSAYFGARIKVYIDDIKEYLKENRSKFGNMTIGSI